MYLVRIKGTNYFIDWAVDELDFETAFVIDSLSQLAENIEAIQNNGMVIGEGIPDPNEASITKIHVTEINGYDNTETSKKPPA